MIFWIALVAAIALVVITILSETRWYWDTFILPLLSTLSVVAVLVMSIVIAATNISEESYIAANKQRYEILVYQAENNLYDNDNDYGKKELVNQIQEWNEDLAKGKVRQDDFWVGILVPDMYDDFEYIPVEIIGGERK